MKNSKLKKTIVALCLTLALSGAMMCFAGCDSNKSSSDNNEKTEETTKEEEEETTAEETTEETSEETTEAEETTEESEETSNAEEEPAEESKGHEPTAEELEAMVNQFDEKLQPYAQKCIDNEVAVFPISATDLNTEDEDLVASFVDGFMGMGGSLNMSADVDIDENGEGTADSDLSGSDFKIAMGILFKDYESAEKYFDTISTDPSFAGPDAPEPELTETDDGKELVIKDESAEVIITLTNDGIIFLDETVKG